MPPHTDETTPGLGEQFARTRAAFSRLVRAHVALLRAELSEIIEIVKGMALKAALVLGLAFLAAVMLYVGGFLFVGEWLFGSIGWGLAHGTLLPLALIVAFGLGIVGGTRGPATGSFVVGLLVAVGVSLVLGMNLAWQAAAAVSPQVGIEPWALGAIAGAVTVAILLAILLGTAAGRAGALGGLLMGAIVGLLLGWAMTIDEWTWGPAVGLGIALGLIVWPLLNLALTWPRLDIEAHFARLAPRQTMEAVSETREWMEEQWRTRSPLPGKK